ncbi:MAG: WD40 repeat protein [Verrucomicrobiales bacterium]|jgi:WD40 repeat protein
MSKEVEEVGAPKYGVKPDCADPYATWLKRELKHDRGQLASRYDPSGRYLFTGALDNFVHRWDLSDESEEGKREPLAGHESWVRGMDWFPAGSSDQQLLATGDYVGRLIVWPALAEKPTPKLSFAAHDGSIRAVSVCPDGKSIASAGNDGMVRVWSAEDGKNLLELSGHDCHVYHTAFHPDGKSLISADLKGVVKHWQIPTGKLIRELDASLLHTYSEKYTVDVGGIRGMSFNADGSQLACTGSTGDDKGIRGDRLTTDRCDRLGLRKNGERTQAWDRISFDGLVGPFPSRWLHRWLWRMPNRRLFVVLAGWSGRGISRGQIQATRARVRCRHCAGFEDARRRQSRWCDPVLGNGS